MKENLSYRVTDVYEQADESRMREIMAYAEAYKAYLDKSKTEREAVRSAIELAERAGYRPYRLGDALKPGDCVYYNNRNKNLFLMKIGTEDIEKTGLRILAAHVDSPRLDLKQNPLYDSDHMAFFKVHYYGGIKKYQWTAIPLALHGSVVREDGSVLEVNIGEEPGDPVLYVNDLLPHLSQEQNKKTLQEAVPAESLNLLAGGIPEKDCEKDPVKANLLSLLWEKYGIREEDFLSAELSAVPAFPARDVGLDRAFVGAYGHDDRVCGYAALSALLSDRNTGKTSFVVLADKEEIGSEGNTGMQCRLLSDLIELVCRSLGKDPILVRAASRCLSADVTAAYDPNYASAFEKQNSTFVSCGAAMSKFTGSRGKSGSNDASAEFVGELRRLFRENGVTWQMGELGKVDLGGGGTVAMFLAKENIDTVDLGVPVLSMHAPYEVISKADLYSLNRAFAAFLK